MTNQQIDELVYKINDFLIQKTCVFLKKKNIPRLYDCVDMIHLFNSLELREVFVYANKFEFYEALYEFCKLNNCIDLSQLKINIIKYNIEYEE